MAYRRDHKAVHSRRSISTPARVATWLALVSTAGCAQWLLGVDDESRTTNGEPAVNIADGAWNAMADSSVVGEGEDARAVSDSAGVVDGAVMASHDAAADAQPADSSVPAASCAGATADCDGDPLHICETDLSRSVLHCGACGRVCSVPQHATARCSAGGCAFECESGYIPVGTGCQAAGPANACTAADYALYSNISFCFISRNQLCGPANSCSECTGGECCAEVVRSGRVMRACLSTTY